MCQPCQHLPYHIAIDPEEFRERDFFELGSGLQAVIEHRFVDALIDVFLAGHRSVFANGRFDGRCDFPRLTVGTAFGGPRPGSSHWAYAFSFTRRCHD